MVLLAAKQTNGMATVEIIESEATWHTWFVIMHNILLVLLPGWIS